MTVNKKTIFVLIQINKFHVHLVQITINIKSASQIQGLDP